MRRGAQRSPPGRDLGLGLDTVRGIALQAGGAVRVRSTEGQGTTVTVYLPEHGGGVTVSPVLLPSGETGPSGGTVLLVDDEEMVRRVARRLLERMGCTVL